MKVKIFIALKSFEAKQLSMPEPFDYTPHKTIAKSSLSKRKDTLFSKEKPTLHKSNIVSIALPKTQSNYTVLRSPHIDKKSRDQFELKIHKQLIIISTEIKQIREKLFNLKFHEMPGVQMKVIFQTKTRLSFS